MTAKCVFWIVIRDAHLESRFEIRYFDRVYAKSRRDSWFEMRNSKTLLDRDLRCASQITNLDVIGVHTVQNTVFGIVIQDAHLESQFKIRTLPSCENSLWFVTALFFLFGILFSFYFVSWYLPNARFLSISSKSLHCLCLTFPFSLGMLWSLLVLVVTFDFDVICLLHCIQESTILLSP